MANLKAIVEGALVTLSSAVPFLRGKQPASQSMPVVVATDQEPLPVREVDKTRSEVELNMLGIPRIEERKAYFSDVTTYEVNRLVWQASRRNLPQDSDHIFSNTAAGSAFEHFPLQSSGKITSRVSRDSAEFAFLSTRQAMAYLPGKISAGTFGINMSVSTYDNDIKKVGCFDGQDGYYFEVQGGAQDDKRFNFFCVRRSSSYAAFVNPRQDEVGILGVDLVVKRDGLNLIHAGLFDKRLRVATGGVLISNGTVSFRVASTYAYTYEYRVPRAYFAFDRADGSTDQFAYYADVVPGGESFSFTISGTADNPFVAYSQGSQVPEVTMSSVWNIDFRNVIMLSIEYSWYGAVGATFLMLVPDRNSPGDARWVRIHSIRGSNQLTVATLSNPYLPLSYYASKGNAEEAWVQKFGASFYIDGNDEGTSIPRSAANVGNVTAPITGELVLGIKMRELINNIRNRQTVYPISLSCGSTGLVRLELIKNPIISGTPTWVPADSDNLIPLAAIETTTTSGLSYTGGTVLGTYWVNGSDEFDLTDIFAYNREFLSLPTASNSGDTLFIKATGQNGTVSVNAAIGWLERK